jgi:Zn-finger nucleic acid-binding protein
MARCKSCSAPLPANTNRCSFCNIRNDVDLHGRHTYSMHSEQSDRMCPHCAKNMQTIKLDLKDSIHIERCNSCFGLFFDPGEIETLLESSVSNVFNINLEHMDNINQDRFQSKKKVKYIKCPVCQKFMNRVNFGSRSGVIIDQCIPHGIWLDSGEITHLMEWKKAGGVLLNAKEKEREKANKKKKKPANQAHYSSTSSYDTSIFQQQSKSMEYELFETVASLVYKLFR